MEKQKVKATLHGHLTSFNVKKPFNKIIDTAYKRLGPGGIFGQIHFGNGWYKQVAESPEGYERIDLGNCFYVPEKDNLVCINGQEVLARTKEGIESHLLVLAHDKNTRIKNERTIEDSIKEAKDAEGIVGIDHPFSPYGSGHYFEKYPELIRQLDFVEVYNNLAGFWAPSFPFFPNKKAEEFYKEWKKIYPNLGSIISDDNHSLFELGRNWMMIPLLDLTNSDTVRKSLKKGLSIERKPSEEKRTGILSPYFFGSIHAGISIYSRIIGNQQIDFDN
ncbi:MAG: hypothetical protein PVJ67_00355 [Candidatus Pacearchaeota archaeon]|jgi:hypothetical protein